MLTTFARIAKILKGLVEPRNWVEEAFGDISGGGGNAIIVRGDENGLLDKTWKEIMDAGSAVLVREVHDGTFTNWIYYPLGDAGYKPADSQNPPLYGVAFGGLRFSTDSENGYPLYTE